MTPAALCKCAACTIGARTPSSWPGSACRTARRAANTAGCPPACPECGLRRGVFFICAPRIISDPSAVDLSTGRPLYGVVQLQNNKGACCMSLDRRSFRVGVIAGVFLLSGVLVGVLFSAGSGWMSPGTSAPSLSPVALSASNGFPAVAKAAMPAVVNISTTRVVKSQGGHPASPFKDDPVFRHFFGDQIG